MGDGNEVDFWVLSCVVSELLKGFLSNCGCYISSVIGHRINQGLHGHPQWRRKVTTVGFPFGFGICSFELEGAFEPTSGTGDSSTALGLNHEFNSCWNVMMSDRWRESYTAGPGCC
jgi:hypothetical protein